jgi:hypothetical protein
LSLEHLINDLASLDPSRAARSPNSEFRPTPALDVETAGLRLKPNQSIRDSGCNKQGRPASAGDSAEITQESVLLGQLSLVEVSSGSNCLEREVGGAFSFHVGQVLYLPSKQLNPALEHPAINFSTSARRSLVMRHTDFFSCFVSWVTQSFGLPAKILPDLQYSAETRANIPVIYSLHFRRPPS